MIGKAFQNLKSTSGNAFAGIQSTKAFDALAG